MISNSLLEVVKREAAAYDLPYEVIAAIIDKESGGHALYNGLPSIRIEGHYVYKLTTGAVREKLVQLGLASSKAGAVKNPRTMDARYAMLKRIAAIAGKEIAYRSCSVGMGQIMINHYVVMGYPSAVAMFSAACTEDGQVQHIMKFISADPKLRAAVIARNYPVIARIYNGPKYKQNNYDADLKSLVRVYAGTPIQDPYTKHIEDLGYPDVRTYQTANDLVVDGILGVNTRAAVDLDLKQARKDRTAKGAKAIASVSTGTVLAGGSIADATNTANDLLTTFDPVINFVKEVAPYSIKFAAAVAAGFALWYAYNQYKHWKAS